MSLIGRKPPTAAELDPFGYWAKPAPTLGAYMAGPTAEIRPVKVAGGYVPSKPAGKWVETFPHLPGNARSEHFVPSKRPLSPGLDMPREGYGHHTPLPSSRRRVTGPSEWRRTNANGKLNRGAIRKAIDEGELEARFWLRTDDQVDYRRDTNNPWLPARVGESDVAGFMTFTPYWFRERGVRAYKGDDGTYRFAVTHNHILQLRSRA